MRSIPVARASCVFTILASASAFAVTWEKDPNVHPSLIDNEPALTSTTFVSAQDDRVLLFGAFTDVEDAARTANGVAYLDASFGLDAKFSALENSPVSSAVPLSNGGVLGVTLIGGGWEIPSDSELFRLTPEGKLDPTYSRPQFPGTANLVNLPDGRIFGWYTDSGSVYARAPGMFMLSSDGSVDATFTATLPDVATITAAAGQPDGKILVAYWKAGTGDTPAKGRLARLTASGEADPTFTPVETERAAATIALSAGKIVMTLGQQLLRFNSDGSVDPTFHASVPANVSPTSVFAGHNDTLVVGAVGSSGSPLPASAFILNADGSLLSTIEDALPNGHDVRVKCVTTSGRIMVVHAPRDPENSADKWGWRVAVVSSDGKSATDINLSLRQRRPAYLQSFAIDPQSRLIVTGNFNEIDGAKATSVARFNPDGSYDRTYAPAVTAVGEVEVVGDDGAALIDDYELVTVGAGQEYHRVLRRVLADGTIDATLAPPLYSQWWHAMTADHRVLVSRFVPDSRSEENLQLVWLAADGSVAQVLATRFGGFTSIFGSIGSDPIAWAQPVSDGRILVGGSFKTVNGVARPWLARLLADGSLDPEFIPEIPADLPMANVEPPDPRQRVVITTLPLGTERVSLRILPDGKRDDGFLNIPIWPDAAQFRLENGLPDLAFATATTTANRAQIKPALAVVLPNYTRAVEAPDGSRWTFQPIARYVRRDDPTIIAGPNNQSVMAGARATLYGAAEPVGTATYQWFHDGAPITGATDAVLTLASAKPSDAGHYQVQLRVEGVVASSEPILVGVAGGAGRIMNVSTLTQVAPVQQPTLGFVVADDGMPRTWLLRAISDGLRPFGVAPTLPEPEFWVTGAAGLVAHDRGDAASGDAAYWAAQVGAFPAHRSWSPILFPNAPTSDSGVVSVLNPGSYSFRAAGATGGSGWALLEVYDSAVDGASGGLKNASARNTIGPDAATITLGFTISGPTPVRLLVRGVGPALRGFGIARAVLHPAVMLFDAKGHTVAANTGWGNDPVLASAAKTAGAFPFAAGSDDAATIVSLEHGAYTARLFTVDGGSGEGLVEVYTLPP